MALAAWRAELDKLRQDLTAAYGEAPPQVDRLLRLAQIRVACATLGVKAVILRTPDVIFRAEDPRPIAEALAPAKGTVTTLAPKTGQTLSEVYWRPPPKYLDPQSLPRVLLSRLRPEPQGVNAGV